MNWEIKAIEALRPFGDLLEGGFSSGSVSAELEKFHLKSHTILEPDATAAKNGRHWAGKYPSVKVLEESWESALPGLGIFDAIFAHSHFGKREIPLVKKGKEILREIEEQLPEIVKMRYTDTELDAFCQSAALSSKEHLSQFLMELEEKGQIQKEQREKMVRKYHLKPPPKREMAAPSLLPFVHMCLNSHMRKKSKLCCPSSLADERGFVEKISGNPHLEVIVEKSFVLIEKIS